MASFTKINQFTEDLCTGVHDFSTDSIYYMLANAAPNATTAANTTNVTEIAAGNGYLANGFPLTITSVTETSGTCKVLVSNTSITASGGSIADFRYVVVYNYTSTGSAHRLVGYYDNGSTVSLTDGSTYSITFGASNGMFSVV